MRAEASKQDMPLWKRTYRCSNENCGLVMDCDEHSAVNIYQRFLAGLPPTRKLVLRAVYCMKNAGIDDVNTVGHIEKGRSIMEKESETTIQEGAQNDSRPAEPPQAKPSRKKRASTSSASRRSTERRMQAALAEEQHKAAAAQAGVEDLQRRLAAVEAALAEERSKATRAQQALAT